MSKWSVVSYKEGEQHYGVPLHTLVYDGLPYIWIDDPDLAPKVADLLNKAGCRPEWVTKSRVVRAWEWVVEEDDHSMSSSWKS